MKPGRITLTFERAGNIAIFALVAAVFVTVALTEPALFSDGRWLAFSAGLLLFTVLAERSTHCENRPRLLGALLLGQSLVLVALTLLSDNAFIVPMLSFIIVSISQSDLPYRSANAFDLVLVAAIILVYLVPFGWEAALQAGLGFGAGFIFIIVFTRVAKREREAREQVEALYRDLERANAQLGDYAAQVEQMATMRERNRLARDVHDSLGHYLTVINVQLEVVTKLMESDPARARDAALKAKELASEGLAEVRRSVAALRPSPLDDRPLPDAIRSLTEAARDAGLMAGFEQSGAARPLSAEVETILYRAAQEALTNIRKHAHASSADVRLSFEADGVRLRVRDNGLGRKNDEDSVGLSALRERVLALNGEVVAENHPQGGFVLDVSLPYPESLATRGDQDYARTATADPLQAA